MFYIGYFSFSLIHLELKIKNTFIRSRGFLENHTRFQTIIVKIYGRFQTKMIPKTIPFGRHIPI